MFCIVYDARWNGKARCASHAQGLITLNLAASKGEVSQGGDVPGEYRQIRGQGLSRIF